MGAPIIFSLTVHNMLKFNVKDWNKIVLVCEYTLKLVALNGLSYQIGMLWKYLVLNGCVFF